MSGKSVSALYLAIMKCRAEPNCRAVWRFTSPEKHSYMLALAYDALEKDEAIIDRTVHFPNGSTISMPLLVAHSS